MAPALTAFGLVKAGLSRLWPFDFAPLKRDIRVTAASVVSFVLAFLVALVSLLDTWRGYHLWGL